MRSHGPGRGRRRSRSRAGDEVAAGDVVAVLESMKMELSLTAPFAGRVRQVLVAPNVQVGAHAPLLRLDPLDGRRRAPRGASACASGRARRTATCSGSNG